jgi:hypothetical protein
MERQVWKVNRPLTDTEVTSDVAVVRVRRMDVQRVKRVRPNGSNMAMTLSVVTPTPAGALANIVRRRALVRSAADRALVFARTRPRPTWAQIPEPVTVPLSGMHIRPAWKSITLEADRLRRARRIAGTKNEMAFNYAWAQWGEPWGYILEEIQLHMLEPVRDLGESWHDGLWERDEVIAWLKGRVNQFLLETGVKREQVTIAAAGEVDLPDANEIRRVIYVAGDGGTTPLEIGDLHALDSKTVGWEGETGTPSTILLWGSGGRAKLNPAPTTGTLLVDYVPHWEPEPWDDEGNEVGWRGGRDMLPIPAIFSPYIKYGIMADMFSKEGESKDPGRASYCETRFAEGVSLANMLVGRSEG